MLVVHLYNGISFSVLITAACPAYPFLVATVAVIIVGGMGPAASFVLPAPP